MLSRVIDDCGNELLGSNNHAPCQLERLVINGGNDI